MNKADLNRKLIEDIHAEEDSVILGKKHDRRYVVAACSASLKDPRCFIESNGHANESDFDYRLVSRIRDCFNGKTVGENSGLEKWPIGQCAEQHAANTVLKNTFDASIDDFQFSDALITRTPDLPIPYCQNCKTLFPQLK